MRAKDALVSEQNGQLRGEGVCAGSEERWAQMFGDRHLRQAHKSLLRVCWSVGTIYTLQTQTLGLWKERDWLSIRRQLGVGWNPPAVLLPECPDSP